MLKGLEVSEVWLSKTIENKDFRIDSQFYANAPLRNQNLEYVKIGSILKLSQYGISIEMNEDGIGYPIYRMNEIHNMLCDIDVSKCADISEEEYKLFALKDKDVLFNRTNSFEWVGRTGVYYKNDEKERTFASYLVRFNPDEKIILPEYLCTFLNSRQGVWDIKRRARQSINQTNVNPEEVKEIEIPILSMDLQYAIRDNYVKANHYRIQSKQLFSAAEDQLLSELGLKYWQPQNQNINVKTLSESFLSSGRLDAEYYQSKYDNLFAQLSKYECDTIKRIAHINKSVEPGSDAYQDNGIPFVRVSDVNKFGISEPNIFLSPDEFDLSSLRPKKDTILLSKDGSVGIAYKVEKDLDCITSGALLHLTVFNKDYNPDYLTLVLNSKIVKMQAERDANGAIIQHWKPSEIEQVIIPKLPMSIQEEISAKIQKSFALKAESKRLLEQAKLMVEQEIEKGGE